MKKEDVEKFLDELTELTRRYKITIGACGCCESPFLLDESRDGRYQVCITEPLPESPSAKATTEWIFDSLCFIPD